MRAYLQRGEQVACPHCRKVQEEKVEDYVVPGRVGAESEQEDECWDCGGGFSVTHLGNNRYEVCASPE